MKYYVYKLIDPETNLPFYVGKGSGDRMYRHVKYAKLSKNCSNPYTTNKINSIIKKGLNIEYLKIFETDNEFEAYEKEIEEIKNLRNLNIKLCNFLDGGIGGNGRFTNPIERGIKISKALKGKKFSNERYNAMKPVWKNNGILNTGKKRNDVTKHILSLQKIGNKNPSKRKEVRDKISKAIRESEICKAQNNPNSIFSKEEINKIRNDWNNGKLTIQQIADKYTSKKVTIEKIIQNKHYIDINWIRRIGRKNFIIKKKNATKLTS